MSSQADRVAALSSWLRERGAQCDALAWPVTFPQSGRGVAAARKVKRKEVLMRIPTSIILTPERAHVKLAWLFEAGAPSMEAHDENDVLALALFLLEAVAEGPAGEFYPYVSCLPELSTYVNMPCEWSEQELALLHDAAMVAEAVQVKEAIASEFKDVAAALQWVAARGGAEGGAAAAAQASRLASVLTWETFRWARHNVTSRIYIYGLGMDDLFLCDGAKDMLPVAMVPLGDMVNHDTTEGGRGLVFGGSSSAGVCDAEWVKDAAAPALSWKPSPAAHEAADMDQGWYVLKAERRYEAGQEVCISYGDRPSRDLLETYGFIVPHALNASEQVALPVLESAVAQCNGTSRPAGAATVSVRRRLLEGLCPDPAAFPPLELPPLAPPGAAGAGEGDDFAAQPPAEAMALLRVLALADADVAQETARVAGAGGAPASGEGLPAAAIPAPVLRELLKEERFMEPFSRENELAALRLLHALIGAEVQASCPAASVTALLLAGGKTGGSFAGLPLPRQIAALAAIVDNEGALQAYLAAQPAPAVPPCAPASGDPLPWEAPVPVTEAAASGAWMGGAAASAGRRAASSLYRCSRYATFLSYLRYIQRMREVAKDASDDCAACERVASPLPPLHGLAPRLSVALEVQTPWAALLLTGRKRIETRSYPLPEELVGVPIAVLESPAPGGLAAHGLCSGTLLGVVVFAACKPYATREEWAADAPLHCVPVDALPQEHGWVEPAAGTFNKWGWVASSALLLDAPAPVALTEGDRIVRSLFRL